VLPVKSRNNNYVVHMDGALGRDVSRLPLHPSDPWLRGMDFCWGGQDLAVQPELPGRRQLPFQLASSEENGTYRS